MPSRLMIVNSMDSTLADTSHGADGTEADTLEHTHEQTQKDDSNKEPIGKSPETGETEGKETDSKDVEMTNKENVADYETETDSPVETACDTDDTEDGVCGGNTTHIHVDTVVVNRDANSVEYQNHDSLKEDDHSHPHVNVQAIPSSRNELNNSPMSGGLETGKRGRSSGKSKKDKVSPFKKKDSLPTKEILNPNSPTPLSTDRCDSSLSTTSGDLCRICQCDKCEILFDSPLVSPCLCSGSLKYIHQACLQKWIKSSDKLSCELCQFEYSMTKKTKPFREWERLDMSPAERRKVICSVTFHVIAITCVVWSLYVLIDRTTEEVEAGTLLWPFWTKLIVVAIGFTGGVVFMYVQCKMYLTLCKKWRMYNKVIIISSISEGQREKANQQGVLRITEKQAQLEEDRPNLTVFNIVNETDSV